MYITDDYSPGEQARDDKAIGVSERATSHSINQLAQAIDELANIRPYESTKELDIELERLTNLVHYLKKPF